MFNDRFILPFSFYNRETLLVARELLGKILCRVIRGKVTAGRIVETEAYLGAMDPASHAYRGPTPRSSIMFEKPGRAYVYFVYGNHFCFNVVTHNGEAGAVLVRALEPIHGIETMVKRRHTENIKELCNGPGKLTQALQITKNDNGLILYESDSLLKIMDAPSSAEGVVESPRIGIKQAVDSFYRFALNGNPFVSKPCPWPRSLSEEAGNA